MDEKLESFVTLLNKQRQVRPAVTEPVRAPSWTQRMFAKRPEAPAEPVPQAAAPARGPDAQDESPAIETPIVPIAAAPDVVAPVEAAPDLAAPVIAAAIAEIPGAVVDETLPAQIVADAPDATVASPSSIAAQSVSAEATAPVAEEAIAAPREEVAATTLEAAPPEPVAEAIAESAALVPEESAPIESVEAVTPAEETISAAAEMPAEAPVAQALSDSSEIAAPVAEAPAIPEETIAPVEATPIASVAADEIAATASMEATPEIAEPVAESAPVAEAPAPIEAAALVSADEIVPATAADVVPEALEAAPEIAAPIPEPIAEAPILAEAVTEPTEAVAEPVSEAVADEVPAPIEAAAVAPIAAEEIVPAVSAAAPEILEAVPDVAAPETAPIPIPETAAVEDAAAPSEAALAVPDTTSPRIAAIFARVALPDSVSATIADSAAAVVSPPEMPAVAATSAPEATVATAEPVAAEPVVDALRDPQDLLARFLAETDLDIVPAPERVLAEAAAKLDQVLHAVDVEPAPIQTDEDLVDADDESEPAVPLPVMADAVAAARVSRGYLRYGLTAIAVFAGVGVVGGAYLSTQKLSATLAGAGGTAAPSVTVAMNGAPAKPAVTRADPPAARTQAVTAKADGTTRVTGGAPIPNRAASILASLPPAKSATGLAIVEAKSDPTPARPAESSATVLAQMPRQLAMLTFPPPEPPPSPVTSSMAPPPVAAPPSSPPPARAAAVPQGPQPAWERNAMPAPPYSGKPQIAIVIDDLGIDRDRTERSVGLNSAVTLSFLAYASDLPTQTEAARRAGHELIVHVPMEPVLRPKYVSQSAGGGEAQAELLRRLRWDLSRFSGYVGVNNHMGSRLSADPQAMHTVIGELKTRGLLFLDSRLDGNTIDVAHQAGVAAVGRDVLLDDDITAGSVADRLTQLEKVARERGTAIALGHPHDQTINALKLWIASLPAKGLQLVPLSAIVKDREAHAASGGGAG